MYSIVGMYGAFRRVNSIQIYFHLLFVDFPLDNFYLCRFRLRDHTRITFTAGAAFLNLLQMLQLGG